MRAAVAGAREKLRAAPDQARAGGLSNRPPVGWGHLDGVELVVRGTGDGIGGRRRVQIARARLKGWNAHSEDRFLEALAATCNVKAACAAVGLSAASAYHHRGRWPGFARRWDAVATVASERIEAGLFQAGANLDSSDHVPVDVPITGMTADHALQLLRLFHSAPRPGRRAGRPVEVASIAETCRALEEALAKHRRQRARREARGATGGG